MQGNDIGTQYRSVCYCKDEEELALVKTSLDKYQNALSASSLGSITTELKINQKYYLAEEYHQQYLDKNPGVKLSISVESSASNLPATNKLVDGFTSPDHSYGKMMPANKWTTDDTKKTIVENGNAFLAKGRARSTITELAKFLDSKEVKQNGKSTISYGESDLVITMTSGVNGIKYIGPGKTPSSKFKPFQYVKIKATGFMIKPEPKPKNQITSWRLQIGAQMK